MKAKGYLQIYTGSGKGKTTAALGLCLRAAGHGIHSVFLQFMKGSFTGELKSAELLSPYLTIEQYGSSRLLTGDNPDVFAEHKTEGMKGFYRAEALMREGLYGIIVLDEILNLLHFGLIELSMIIKLIEAKPEDVELILTGRGAPEELIQRADLVTEMKEIKHYYPNGIPPRKGIEF